MIVKRFEIMSQFHDIYANILADYYMPLTLVLVTCGSIATTRWFFCRLCHGSVVNYYRWLAVWPVVIYILSLWVTGLVGGDCETPRHLSPVIALSFGFLFSVSNFKYRRLGYSVWSIFCIVLFWQLTRSWIEETSVYITM